MAFGSGFRFTGVKFCKKNISAVGQGSFTFIVSILATNRKAYYLFKILKVYEAGIQLEGWEVKSIRQGRISLRDSFVKIINFEPFLINAYIPPYQRAQGSGVDTRRPRKLLLKKKTILFLKNELSKRHLTMVPLKVYTKRRLLKVEIALVKGKRGFEKRREEKERSVRLRLENDVEEALGMVLGKE